MIEDLHRYIDLIQQRGLLLEEIKEWRAEGHMNDVKDVSAEQPQEHRKCIAELNRLKAMISDLHKFIATLHGKLLQTSQEKMKHGEEHSQEVLKQLQEEMEQWRAKALPSDGKR